MKRGERIGPRRALQFTDQVEEKEKWKEPVWSEAGESSALKYQERKVMGVVISQPPLLPQSHVKKHWKGQVNRNQRVRERTEHLISRH